MSSSSLTDDEGENSDEEASELDLPPIVHPWSSTAFSSSRQPPRALESPNDAFTKQMAYSSSNISQISVSDPTMEVEAHIDADKANRKLQLKSSSTLRINTLNSLRGVQTQSSLTHSSLHNSVKISSKIRPGKNDMTEPEGDGDLHLASIKSTGFLTDEEEGEEERKGEEREGEGEEGGGGGGELVDDFPETFGNLWKLIRPRWPRDVSRRVNVAGRFL